MSRSHDRWSGLGMATAEYAVCLTCALGLVSLLTSDWFSDVVLDLLSTVWRMALQPRHFVMGMVVGLW